MRFQTQIQSSEARVRGGSRLVVLGGHLAGALRLALPPLELEQLRGVDGCSQRLRHQLHELVGAELGTGMNETPRRGTGEAAAAAAGAAATARGGAAAAAAAGTAGSAAAATAAVARRWGGVHKSDKIHVIPLFHPGRPVYATDPRSTHTRTRTSTGKLDHHSLTSRAERAPKL